MTLSGPPRDPVGTGFGRGFLSPSCPALATTPVPSTLSAKPRPARLFFLSPPFPPPALHQMHQPATFSKLVSGPNPRSSLHLRPPAPPNCCKRASVRRRLSLKCETNPPSASIRGSIPPNCALKE